MCVSGVGSPATRRLECKVFSGCFLFSFLPPANEVCEGYDFTGICLSTGGGVSVHRGVSLFGGISVWGFLSRVGYVELLVNKPLLNVVSNETNKDVHMYT